METYCLRFKDEAEAESKLADYRIDDDWVSASHAHALDVVGVIYKDGVPIVGFHVNLKCDMLPEALSAYLIHPVTPSRVFA